MTIAVDLGRKATKQTNNNILFMFNSTMTIKHAFADQHQVLASRKKNLVSSDISKFKGKLL